MEIQLRYNCISMCLHRISMYFLVALFSMTLGLVIPSYSWAAVELKSTSPRLANYFLHWTISDSEAQELAKWDLLILDAETAHRSPQALVKIRALNPSAILLAYLPAAEIRQDWSHLREVAPLRYKLGQQVSDLWFLKNGAGERRSFWPGTWILNVTEQSPVVNNEQWNDFLPRFAAQEILSNTIWDGVFYDNGWESITYFAGGAPDLNGDSQAEDGKQADKLWQEGLRAIYKKTKELAPNKIIVENDGVVYAPNVDGVFRENFYRQADWTKFTVDLKKIKSQSQAGLAILNANTQNQGDKKNWAAMRYGLGVALLHNAFYSFDYGDQDHGQTWWYDEYDVFLGEAIGEAKRLGSDNRGLSSVATEDSPLSNLWRRDFENGAIFVNTSVKIQNIRLDEEFEKIIGEQNRQINDGSIVSEFSLEGKDALVVRRPLKELLEAPYQNGAFIRVFDLGGKATRTGFFAYRPRVSATSKIAKVDLDGDDKRETLLAEGARLTIYFGDGGESVIMPYGSSWNGSLNFAFGDVNGDGLKEIIVAPENGGGAWVRVYRPNGELIALPWQAFGPRFKGGANLAVGDLNGDGFAEVIVGAGQGGGPQVRIFSFDGRLLSAGFFAYDPRLRGGVKVAAGDLDGDGKAEIITGPGIGGPPQIKIFNKKGQVLHSGFFAFDSRGRQGVQPQVADIDGDGRMEILGMTSGVITE